MNYREIRDIRQVKVWMLSLNPITANAESINLTLVSSEKDLIKERYEQLKVKCYEEPGHPSGGSYKKSFKKDSVLEWYNPVYGDDLEEANICGVPVLTFEWIDEEELDDLRNFNFEYLEVQE